MEYKEFPSKTIFQTIKEGTLLGQVYDKSKGGTKLQINKKLLLDFQIQSKDSRSKKLSQRLVVSIKPRVPEIRTLFIAEKSRFHSKKASSGSRLAIGDHSSFTSSFSGYKNRSEEQKDKIGTHLEKDNLSTCAESLSSDRCSEHPITSQSSTVEGKCCSLQNYCAQIKGRNRLVKNPITVNVVSVGTNVHPSKIIALQNLHKRIESLERQVQQILLFYSMDPKTNLSSSNEDVAHTGKRNNSSNSRAGCSYIQQYSHIPEGSAFQRYPHPPAPLSPSKATTIEKEHNSEQYGRDFTAYDGITARGRRQCASVPCKRDEAPKLAAERVHKIRHKLNPVRDYRLMDNVHYLAQGEFAPREDGIKLTPSREAVLSDIIWEDVCRTHWPSTRLGRRQPERCSTRYELQKLIDNLLRERVAHVERRRRRHYRIVKLNHRHESCRPLGKTGDIIVASHKDRQASDEREIGSEHNATWRTESPYKAHRSYERFCTRQRRRSQTTDSSPGPSKVKRSINSREPTICYQTSSPLKIDGYSARISKIRQREASKYYTSSSSASNANRIKQPRFLVKKNSSSRKRKITDEPDLEHFILLPTLVVRTPSNVRRQRKFNELYQRILNTKINNSGQESSSVAEESGHNSNKKEPIKRDIGLNINITLSESEEKLKK